MKDFIPLIFVLIMGGIGIIIDKYQKKHGLGKYRKDK